MSDEPGTKSLFKQSSDFLFSIDHRDKHTPCSRYLSERTRRKRHPCTLDPPFKNARLDHELLVRSNKPKQKKIRTSLGLSAATTAQSHTLLWCVW
jgi:hypothetical protein